MGRSRRLRVCPPVPRTHAQAPTRRASDRADGKPPKLERSDESQVERSIDTSSPDPPCRDSGPLQAGCGPRSSRTVPPVVATADSEPGPRRPAVTAGAPGSGRAGPVMAWWPGTPLARAGAARRRCVAHGGRRSPRSGGPRPCSSASQPHNGSKGSPPAGLPVVRHGTVRRQCAPGPCRPRTALGRGPP